jgi:general stress protein CsbA
LGGQKILKQIRVLRNVVCLGLFCLFALWLVRSHLWEEHSALGLGAAGGGLCGWLWWRYLTRQIARRNRRYERNKIFVHYLNVVEVAITAIAYNHYFAIPLVLSLLAMVFFLQHSSWWWTVFIGSGGLAAASVLTGGILHYEQQHGRLHYQYDNQGWTGAEGMLYQCGTVVQPLVPAGKVRIQGVLWNAVSLSGEIIDVGEQVEVISHQRLSLYVDRLPLPLDH